VVFETTVDDYGEIWVDGKLPRVVGQSGGTVAAGFNIPNRLVIGRNVKPGQKIQLAVFAINAPVSASPGNFLFLRTEGQTRDGRIKFATKLDFYKP
jgi:gluconolactonase